MLVPGVPSHRVSTNVGHVEEDDELVNLVHVTFAPQLVTELDITGQIEDEHESLVRILTASVACIQEELSRFRRELEASHARQQLIHWSKGSSPSDDAESADTLDSRANPIFYLGAQQALVESLERRGRSLQTSSDTSEEPMRGESPVAPCRNGTSLARTASGHSVPRTNSIWSRGDLHKNFMAVQAKTSVQHDDVIQVPQEVEARFQSFKAMHHVMINQRRRFGFLENIVQHRYFQLAVLVAISVNTLCAAAEGSYGVVHAFERYDGRHDVAVRVSTAPGWLEVVEECFFYFFAGEILLRIVAYQCLFFFGPDWRWNWFDTLVVSLVDAPDDGFFGDAMRGR